MSTYPIGGRGYEFGIADRMRVVREQAGLDQDQLAELTGISRSTISNYERGQTKPRRSQILSIALATGFHPHWLETGEMPENPHPDGPDGGEKVRHQGLEPRTRWLNSIPGQAVLEGVAA